MNLRKCYFAGFSSITLNNHKRRFSQPKLELYRLFCALHTYKIFIISIQNLIVKVDARYSMLNNPDIAPFTSINCWIVSIFTFHFELRHISKKHHGLDDWVDNL